MASNEANDEDAPGVCAEDVNADDVAGTHGATTTTPWPDAPHKASAVPATAERRHDSSGSPSSEVVYGEHHLHQTLDRVNDGIGEIASALKALLAKGWEVPGGREQARRMPFRQSSPERSRSRGGSRTPKTDRSASPAASHGSGSLVSERPGSVKSRDSSPAARKGYMKTSWEVTANVRDCTWEQFKNRFSKDEDKSAIDVLVAGPDLKAEMKREQANRAPNFPESKSLDTAPEESTNRSSESWIHRVRIQSISIHLLLRMVGGEEYHIWRDTTKTFLRPFRMFVRFHAEMRDELQNLKKYRDLHPNSEPGDDESVMKDTTIDHDSQDVNIAVIAKIPGSVDQIECFLDFVEDRILPDYQKFDVVDPKTPYQVRFDDLWYLFRVGDLLYAPKKDVSRLQNHNIATAQTIWRIFDIAIPGDRRQDVEFESFSVQCYYVDYDGTEFGAVTTSFDLQLYDGERNVTSLPFYPLRFAPNFTQLLEHAQLTGKNFLANIENPSRYGSYSGWTLIHNPLGEPAQDEWGQPMRTPEHINSDIIVDMREGLIQCPTWKPQIILGVQPRSVWLWFNKFEPHIVWSDAKRSKRLMSLHEEVVMSDGVLDWDYNRYIKHDKYIAMKADEDHRRPAPAGEDLALLPRRIIGYALWERKFVQLDVRFLNHMAMEDKNNPFDKLQIEPVHKTLIQSIVTSHFTRNDLENKGTALGTQDIIRGKGKGVVILLHGVPGVGKTATAEAVAQKWGRPLFPITCGDLGSTAESVEKSLNSIFRLAKLWDCVLLLDEADVFITQRTKYDLQRNALVSVFLRMLEYYNGILFLTTNRPGVIDEAVKSRVHLSLRYDALSLDQMRAIFDQNIVQLRDIEQKRATALNTAVMDIFDDEIVAFAEQHWNDHTDHVGRWNGRQIRNAFSIAASLAHFEAQEKSGRAVQLRAEHFRKVQAATLVYDKYRASILTGTDGDVAKAHEARNDDFDEHAFTTRGPQQRGQKAAQMSAKYHQGQGAPSTPVNPYGHVPQAGGSPLPPGSSYAPQSGGPSSAQHGGYLSAYQGSYPQAQAESHAQAQPGRQLPVRQFGGLPLAQPEVFAPGQQGGYPPAPLTPQRVQPAPHGGNYTLAPQGPGVNEMAQGTPYDGQDARERTAYGNYQVFVQDGSQIGSSTQPQQMQQP